MQVLRLHSKMMTSVTYACVWSYLTGVPQPSDAPHNTYVAHVL